MPQYKYRHSSKLGEFGVKVVFYGDAITPVYRFSVYEPRNSWYGRKMKKVWEESVHRDNITHYTEACEKVISNYLKDKERWE